MNQPPARWWFVGSSGSGKSTYARAVARALDVPFVELDAIYHQAEWQPLATEQFRRRVRDLVADESWVVDGNYSLVRDLVRDRAQLIVALDFPRVVIMRQLIWRTWRRGVRREELWNGNRETLRNFWRWNPERSVVRWSWTHYHATREKIDELAQRAAGGGAPVVRVTTHAEARAALHRVVGTDVAPFLG